MLTDKARICGKAVKAMQSTSGASIPNMLRLNTKELSGARCARGLAPRGGSTSLAPPRRDAPPIDELLGHCHWCCREHPFMNYGGRTHRFFACIASATRCLYNSIVHNMCQKRAACKNVVNTLQAIFSASFLHHFRIIFASSLHHFRIIFASFLHHFCLAQLPSAWVPGFAVAAHLPRPA